MKEISLSSPLPWQEKSSEQKGRSLWQDALHRLAKDKVAMVSFVVIVFYLILAALSKLGIIFSNFDLVNNEIAYQSPSWEHWLGTDLFGRDVLARAAHGTVTSLTVGFAGTGLSMVIGTVLGALAGYFGGKMDEAIVWFYTTIDTVPYILLVIAFSMVIGSGLNTICLVIGLTFWVNHCRVMRAEFMKHRDREYVQSAVSLGASHLRRIFIHILPNVSHLVLINFSLGVVTAIMSEVMLSYLGLGVEPGVPSWGMMISDAKLELSRQVWWGLAGATGFMFFLVLSLILFNDALRDALDPKLKNK
ncbi:MAG: ABC transporter permease [Bdellovibrionales bacterium]|nr:ABC transporter permease [Bdellovibrionales bacterium]